MITEDQLEQLSLDWFRDCGWDYANGVDISPDGDDPERDDYRVVAVSYTHLTLPTNREV